MTVVLVSFEGDWAAVYDDRGQAAWQGHETDLTIYTLNELGLLKDCVIREEEPTSRSPHLPNAGPRFPDQL